jgi:hypothetical protein
MELGPFVIVATASGLRGKKMKFGVTRPHFQAQGEVLLGLIERIVFESSLSGIPVILHPEIEGRCGRSQDDKEQNQQRQSIVSPKQFYAVP